MPRALTPGAWAEWRELRLAALREAPYAFSAKLADWQGAGDTEQRWRDRLGGASLNLLADFDGRPAGMISGMPAGDSTAELISLWVAPFARGHGLGDELVEAVLRWAAENRFELVKLQVAEANRHAVSLYRRHGFVQDGPDVTRLVRRLP